MPLFKRPDGDLIRDVPPVRRMLPYLMKTRTECYILHEQNYDVTRARKFLRAYNRAEGCPQAATLFHLYMWACARATHELPLLNRFVSNKRLYQRRKCEISFAAKETFERDAPLVTVKVELPEHEDFAAYVDRIVRLTGENRRGEDAQGKELAIRQELRILTRLPSFLLSLVVAAGKLLDRYNLMPTSMIENDPMYASLFLANLGSVGLDNTYHHLYEYGTIPLFGSIGTVGKKMFVNRRGEVEVRDGMQVRWTFDERVNDGFACARVLDAARRYFEKPDEHIALPDGSRFEYEEPAPKRRSAAV